MAVVNCGSRVTSKAVYIDVYDKMRSTMTLDLGDNGPCGEWIKIQVEQKRDDLGQFVLGVLDDECGLLATCSPAISFICPTRDSNRVNVT